MNESEAKKLRMFYHSLLGLKDVLQDAAMPYMGKQGGPRVLQQDVIIAVSNELIAIEQDFPNLLPPFKPEDSYFYAKAYYADGILAYVAKAIARLEVLIDSSESSPVTQTRDFTFIADGDLRKIVERDYVEIQRAFIAKCWKSVIILTGGAIEAILLDCVQRDSTKAAAASKAPKKPGLSKWDLSELINVCLELGYVTSGVEKLSHSVREYRNLVHPGNEIRNKLTFDAEEGRIALEVLHMVHRDLAH